MTPKRPNVIFIVLDTAGAKHMSLYGYPRRTTPNLEHIAEECTVYTRCFAPASWTIPSHASMFTGLYPSQHGAYEGNFFLSENMPHLIPALKMAGYRTYGISSNGLVAPVSGLCPGFDYFKDFGAGYMDRFLAEFDTAPDSEIKRLSERLAKGVRPKDKLGILFDYGLETGRFDLIAKKVGRVVKSTIMAQFLGRGPFYKSSVYSESTRKLCRGILNRHDSDGDPFFLFINFVETHERYRPPLRWRKFSHWWDVQAMDMWDLCKFGNSHPAKDILATYLNLYDDELYYLDHVIGRIWDDFRQSSFFDNTVFIVTSDHGEHFGEKGYFAHAMSLYNELIWVPSIIRFPDSILGRGVDDRLVSLTDLYSTILDLAESPLPRPETSISLLARSKRDFTLAQSMCPEKYHRLMELRKEGFKSMGWNFSPPVMAALTAAGMKIIELRDGTLEIYDCRGDMAENHNLVPGMSPEALENYKSMMELLKEEVGFQDLQETSN